MPPKATMMMMMMKVINCRHGHLPLQDFTHAIIKKMVPSKRYISIISSISTQHQIHAVNLSQYQRSLSSSQQHQPSFCSPIKYFHTSCAFLNNSLANTSNLPLQQTTSSDGVIATPINFDIASTIEGNESQIVTIRLEPNQVLRAESGAMMYMTNGIEMNTTSGGGMSAGFKRMITGQNVFISDYSYKGEEGTNGLVCLGTDFPSKILRLNVDEYGGKIICQKGALLCASHTIDIEMEFTKKLR
jgi:hypothetical protein